MGLLCHLHDQINFIWTVPLRVWDCQSGQVAYTRTLLESLLPTSYPQAMVPVKTCMKADSGVTYNVPVPPRKRCIDSLNQNISTYPVPDFQPNNNMPGQLLSFVGQEIPLQMHQHQLEIDHIVAQHVSIFIMKLHPGY